MWRLEESAAVAAQVGPAQVVDEEEDEVELPLRPGLRSCGEGTRAEQASACGSMGGSGQEVASGVELEWEIQRVGRK